MISDFGDSTKAEVDSRIERAVDQNLTTVAQSWRLVRALIDQLRNSSVAKSVSSTNGTGDSESADGLSPEKQEIDSAMAPAQLAKSGRKLSANAAV